MKKKVIFAVATGLFALAMVFNMNVLQSNNTGDVSLESIAVMAQANPENGGGETGGGGSGDAGACCLNGYKSWFNTSNIPTQRKQSFRDCWCKPQEGYDPVNCSC